MKNLDENLKHITIHPSMPKLQDCTRRWGGSFVRDSHTLFYVLEGAFAYTVGDRCYIVKKHDLALAPANQLYACWNLPNTELRLLTFGFYAEYDGEDFFSYFGCDETHHVVSLPDKADEIMRIYKTMMFPEEVLANLPHRMLWCAELTRLCVLFVQARISYESAKHEFSKVIQYMHAHLTEDIPLETLSKSVHLNPTYFSTKFKEQMGLSPMKYIAHLRATEAANLLRKTDMSVSAIGKKFGFSTIYHFRAFFEKQIGIRPEEYRDMFHEEGENTSAE